MGREHPLARIALISQNMPTMEFLSLNCASPLASNTWTFASFDISRESSIVGRSARHSLDWELLSRLSASTRRLFCHKHNRLLLFPKHQLSDVPRSTRRRTVISVTREGQGLSDWTFLENRKAVRPPGRRPQPETDRKSLPRSI